jgi:dTDP-4-amino-4,6-dideoxygalactose transaminase
MRNAAAARYTSLLTSDSSLMTPDVPAGYKSVWAQYSLLAKNEDARTVMLKNLQDNKIPTAIYYPKPLHRQTAYSYLGYGEGAFPVSEDAASRIFSLPMHPYLLAADQERIAEVMAARL